MSSGNNSPSKICVNDKGKPSFDNKNNAEIFKEYFSNLASDLVKKLKPSPHRLDEVRRCYQHMNLSESFSLLPTSSENFLKLLEEINSQGSILGPLIFLLYVNDMARAVDCDLLLYEDNSCLIIRGSSIEQIESILNRNFNALCDWFVENKLSIHFGEYKTKSILFSRKKCKNLGKLDISIRRGDIKIKQHSKVKYLGCLLDENLSRESMATKMLRKINGKLKFMYRKQNYLDRSLRRLLLKALIQPHFDYACTSWYPGLNKRLSKKIQTAQNKCIRFFLNFEKRSTYWGHRIQGYKFAPHKKQN